jgi:hypothetical protein
MARGGKRPGAGRKPGVITAVREWAHAVLSDAEEIKYWRGLIEDPKTRAEALKYVSDHKHGRAPQSVKVAGDSERPMELIIKHIGTRTTTETI